MRIEILYPELCNLFGDTGNMKYLRLCLPDAEFVQTSLHDTPLFVTGDADMVYMGPCTENSQEKIIKHLSPFKKQLEEQINNNKIFLFTGNAMEVLFNYIETDENEKIQGLGLFDFYAKRQLMKRINCVSLCRFQELDIVGFKTQFTMSYGDNSDCFFASAEHGIGINDTSNLEGIHKNNFFGTNLVGPLLVLNPYFTEYIMKLLGVENPQVAYRKESLTAYNKRLNEIKTKNLKDH